MWTSNKTRFFVLYSRTLVWATSKHNVYLMSHFLGEATSGKHKVLSVQSHVSPAKMESLAVIQGVIHVCIINLLV